ncbi:dTMP kinase [Spirillospora sp. NPDC052269]
MATLAKRGLLVSIDGPGGAGKSALAEAAAKLLRRSGHLVLNTAEPSTGAVGDLIRTGTHYRGLTLACLVAADRLDHLTTEIQPALDSGVTVICDRYTPSSHVLQTLDHVPAEYVAHLNTYAPAPDLAVILTCDPAEITRRLREQETPGRFGDDVRRPAREVAAFADLAERLTGPTLVLDSTSTPAKSLANRVFWAVRTLASGGAHLPPSPGADSHPTDTPSPFT